jgi:hypothetical protein
MEANNRISLTLFATILFIQQIKNDNQEDIKDYVLKAVSKDYQ